VINIEKIWNTNGLPGSSINGGFSMDFPYLNVDFLQGKNFMPLINDWKKNLNQTKEPQTWGTKPTLFWGNIMGKEWHA